MTVSEKLRLVQGLHSHAEMFGFKWDDDSDWTWHDVACKIADEVDAENAKLREYVQTLEAANIDVTSRLQDYIGQYDPTDAFVIEAKTKNDRLRELVHILAYCMSEDRDCDRCVLNGADMPTPRISACDELPDRMRELGVEVETE